MPFTKLDKGQRCSLGQNGLSLIQSALLQKHCSYACKTHQPCLRSLSWQTQCYARCNITCLDHLWPAVQKYSSSPLTTPGCWLSVKVSTNLSARCIMKLTQACHRAFKVSTLRSSMQERPLHIMLQTQSEHISCSHKLTYLSSSSVSMLGA